MTFNPANGRERLVYRRAAIGFRPCDLVPFPLLAMVVGCNLSAAMTLANPFVLASMMSILDGPAARSRTGG